MLCLVPLNNHHLVVRATVEGRIGVIFLAERAHLTHLVRLRPYLQLGEPAQTFLLRIHLLRLRLKLSLWLCLRLRRRGSARRLLTSGAMALMRRLLAATGRGCACRLAGRGRPGRRGGSEAGAPGGGGRRRTALIRLSATMSGVQFLALPHCGFAGSCG